MLATIWKIFKKSFIEALQGKIWKLVFGTFSLTSLASFLLIFKNFFGETNAVVIIKYGAITLGTLFGLRLLLRMGINSFKHLQALYRESVYGDAIIALKDAFAKVHFIRKKERFEDKEFVKTLVDFCDAIKEIFDKKTGKTCSVSIKVATHGFISAEATVQNLCRDSVSTKTRDTVEYDKTNHTILGNTAFSKIVHNVTAGRKSFYYINNDINGSKDYENTSKDVYGGKLPYCSELVVPLIPLLKEGGNFKLMGFLCVDCVDKSMFDEKYDVAIVEGVADGIYDLMLTRHNFFNTKTNVEHESAA